ncbi:MAG: hypothetical protein LBJ44_12340 [Propionibacteriaceae bacterium]|nr:hypothetical protein [Propionibacteriaceae bacterium]
MDVDLARWLVSLEARPYLERAAQERDPSSLAAATRLRRDLSGDRAAAVLDQVALRRRARAKLGELADRVFLTRDGLEQATRWEVARWRAERLVRAGVTGLTDASAGLGFDALAGLRAGLTVRAVERDPATAVLAQANLETPLTGSAEDLADLAGLAAKADQAPPAAIGSGSDPVPPGLAVGAEAPTGSGSDSVPPDLRRRPQIDQPFPPATVLTGPAEDLVDLDRSLVRGDQALFCDPSRRTARGRSWDPGDLSPSWAQLEDWLDRALGPVVYKLAPGLPHRLLPERVQAVWVSHAGDLVETGLWRGEAWPPQRLAVLLPTGHTVAAGPPTPPAGPLGRWLWEPDPAVIRSGAVGAVAELLEAHPLTDRIAYLTGSADRRSVFATRFEILEVLPARTAAVRAWAARAQVGALEIKLRGLDLDPAQWRKQLKLKGSAQASLICAPGPDGPLALVARRD